MYYTKHDILNDLYEIQALFRVMKDAYANCENEAVYPYHVNSLVRVIEKKINFCISDYDMFISEKII